MNSTIWLIVRAALVSLVLLVLTFFPWPDITPYLVYFQQLMNMIMFLNPIWDVPTFFVLGSAMLGIEAILLGRTIFISLVHFITTGSFHGGAAVVNQDTTDV